MAAFPDFPVKKMTEKQSQSKALAPQLPSCELALEQLASHRFPLTC